MIAIAIIGMIPTIRQIIPIITMHMKMMIIMLMLIMSVATTTHILLTMMPPAELRPGR